MYMYDYFMISVECGHARQDDFEGPREETVRRVYMGNYLGNPR